MENFDQNIQNSMDFSIDWFFRRDFPSDFLPIKRPIQNTSSTLIAEAIYAYQHFDQHLL